MADSAPRPWRLHGRDPLCVLDGRGEAVLVAVLHGHGTCNTHTEARERATAVARLAVDSVNAHSPLVDVLQAAEETLRDETDFHLVALHEWILGVLEPLKGEE